MANKFQRRSGWTLWRKDNKVKTDKTGFKGEKCIVHKVELQQETTFPFAWYCPVCKENAKQRANQKEVTECG